jgi:hypothetical protein
MSQPRQLYMPRCLLFASSVALSFMGLVGQPSGLAQPPRLLEVQLENARLAGLPVHWGSYDAALIEPNGCLQLFEQREVKSHRVLAVEFAPQSLAEARAELQAELGAAYETTIAGPYVIAAPAGKVQRWRDRFGALLAGYQRYFEVRGWPLRKPDFPLCVIVWSTREEFLRYATMQAGRLPKNVVGSYFPKSNRCVLYQIEGSRGTDWSETEATIVHEAVHQLAYNTGLHERLAENPVWFVEGLATMFEQSSVYDLRSHQSTIGSRMLAEPIGRLKPLFKEAGLLEQHLKNLIATDDLFQQNPQLAYDLSWALTFYLAERLPSEYRNYYLAMSQRSFGGYSTGERIRDFRSIFGGDLGLLAIQMQRLLGS